MKDRSKNRRKTLIVQSELQQRMVYHVSFYPLMALLVAALSVVFFSGHLTEEASRVEAELPSLGLFLTSVLTMLTIFGLLLIRQALIFSNKIAGPSYRICKTLTAIRQGDSTTRIQLREGDFNTEIAEEINRLLDWQEQQAGHTNQETRLESSRTPPLSAETAPASR